ncbi:MAG TPA: sulfotransferase [Thermoanaerobaculia bacterium]
MNATPVTTESPLQPIFVLSCNRSGSTLLRSILDTHPEIYCPSELSLGHAAHSLAILLAGLEGRDSIQESARKLSITKAVTEPIRTFIQERIANYASRQGKRRWCDITPSNVYHLKLLDILFPEAKHICLYRHALDVTVSAMPTAVRIPGLQKHIYQSSGHVPTGTIRWWCEVTRELLERERNAPDRCFRLRYEDLVRTPGQVLGPLFSFLGLAWDERMLDSVFSSARAVGHEDEESIGTGSSLSLEEVPEEVLSEMRQLLSELGYPEVSAQPPAAEAARKVTMPWFFESFLPGQIQSMPDLAASIDATFRMAIDGPEGGIWIVDLRPDRLGVQPENGQALATLIMSASDLTAVSHGALNASMAFHQGRLRIVGTPDYDKLHKLVQLLRPTSWSAADPL